jgi:hypothetical protein
VIPISIARCYHLRTLMIAMIIGPPLLARLCFLFPAFFLLRGCFLLSWFVSEVAFRVAVALESPKG